jgi:16S rRNA (uracil1498-N3)-methyltransferase
LRDVLRLGEGAAVEVFDATGAWGRGRIAAADGRGVSVEVEEVGREAMGRCRVTIAAAVPKGARADWMIEKLGELGVEAFVPLKTRRSVVEPKGESKSARWKRISAEASRQSGRAGVMRIEGMMEAERAMEKGKGEGMVLWHLSVEEKGISIVELVGELPEKLMVLVGPEGGWNEEETAEFERRGVTGVKLTGTVLRVETAAVVAAGIIGSAFGKTV